MKLQYLGNANDHDALRHLLLLLLVVVLFADGGDEWLMQSESEHTLLARPAGRCDGTPTWMSSQQTE